MPAKPAVTEKLLTEVELELMTILWRLGEGTVSEVLEQLPRARSLAYTSVSTILRILEQKKVVKIRREGRGHVYIPALTKSAYEAKALQQVVERVFDNAPVALVRQLFGSMKIEPAEVLELKDLLDKMAKRK